MKDQTYKLVEFPSATSTFTAANDKAALDTAKTIVAEKTTTEFKTDFRLFREDGTEVPTPSRMPKVELRWALRDSRYTNHYTLFCGSASCGDICVARDGRWEGTASGNSIRKPATACSGFEFDGQPTMEVRRAIEETAIGFFRDCFGAVEIVLLIPDDVDLIG